MNFYIKLSLIIGFALICMYSAYAYYKHFKKNQEEKSYLEQRILKTGILGTFRTLFLSHAMVPSLQNSHACVGKY